MGDLVLFIIIVAVWAITRLARGAGKERDDAQRRRPPAPRGPRPQRERPSQAEEAAVTLEEWMERVRTGQAAEPSTASQPRRRSRRRPTAAEAPAGPEAILEQWQQRTGQPQSGRRQRPVAEPQPGERPRKDPYATRHDQIRKAQEAERAQRQALAAEREREREVLERRETERRRRRKRAKRKVAQPRATPAPARDQAAGQRRRVPSVVYETTSIDPDPRRAIRAKGLTITHAGLRRGILMAEILGPPVALRKPGRTSLFES